MPPALSVTGPYASSADDHAGQGEHGGDRDGDPEQAGVGMSDENATADHDDRQGGRLHGYGETLNDVRPEPVSDALAMLRTGRNSVDV